MKLLPIKKLSNIEIINKINEIIGALNKIETSYEVEDQSKKPFKKIIIK